MTNELSVLDIKYQVSYFIRRAAEENASEYFFGRKALEAVSLSTLRSAISLDNKPREWVVDTVLYQRTYSSIDDANEDISGLDKSLQDDAVIGITVVEFQIIKEGSALPKIERQLVECTDGQVIVQFTRLACNDQKSRSGGFSKTNYAVATLKVPLNASGDEALSELRKQESKRLFVGLESELMLIEILGHKINWLTQQVLPLEGEISALLEIIDSDLDTLNASQAARHDFRATLRKSHSNTTVLAILKQRLNRNIRELTIQAQHEAFFRGRGKFLEILNIYRDNCQRTIAHLTPLQLDIEKSNESLLQVAESAKQNVEAEKALVVRHAEGVLTAVGVGLGISGIADGEFVKSLLGTPSVPSVLNSTLVVLVRSGLSVLAAWITWKVFKYAFVNSDSIGVRNEKE